MKVDLFDYDLPPEAIAQAPCEPRDASKLMEVQPGGVFHRRFLDLPDLLRPDDLLVFNDTKVIPARLTGKRGEASVSVTLLEPLDGLPGGWGTLIKNARRLKVGDMIVFGPDFCAEVKEKREDGVVEILFSSAGSALMAALARYGEMPLPPYIKRSAPSAADKVSYQTLFAAREGAVAAPTAGLHFTPEVMKRLDEKGIRHVFVTLHVGGGTFLPVKVEDTETHAMHAEWGEVSETAAEEISRAKKEGRRIVAIGTTALRILETAAQGGEIHPFSGKTSIFITPGYEFRVPDLLLTNFHLPRSTLLMLVSAFCGLEEIKAAYAEALHRGYRFFSYGDACLLHLRDLKS